MTLLLPDNSEIFVGIRHINLYLFYRMIEAVLLADVHSFKLMLKVPLEKMDQEFVMYKMVVFPLRIFGNRYMKFFRLKVFGY